MCFVWISEQTAITSLYSINCLLRGTDWILTYNQISLYKHLNCELHLAAFVGTTEHSKLINSVGNEHQLWTEERQ